MRSILCCLVLLLPLGAAEEAPHPQLPLMIGRFLQRDYYDPGRFEAAVMIREALRAVESGHAAIDTDWDGEHLQVMVGDRRLGLAIGPVGDLGGVMKLLTRLQQVIMESSTFDQDERRGLVYGMINGALRSLDPHTIVIPPEPAQEFSENVIDGEFFGIGAYLSSQEGAVRIDRVMPGLPADMAGIKDGDVILYIDGETTAGLTLSEAVRRIKGPQGTSVELAMEREGVEEALLIEVVRDRVKPITMRAYREGDIGYVRMDEFNGPSFTDLRVNLLKLKNRHRDRPLRGLVLDLRFNGGGRLDQAHYIADLFLPPGRDVVVTVEPDAKPDVRTSSRSMLVEVPMMVLVSSGSASAAEILAGALQQNDRAVVAGQTTFGKGSVQTWRPLPDKSFVKFTIQEYQLAGGVSIQGQGVVPDVMLTRHTSRRDGRIDMVPYSRRAEADNEFSLAGHGTYFNEARHQLFWLQDFEQEESWEQHRISHPGFVPDQEAKLAIEVLDQALQPVIAANNGLPVQLQRQQLLDALEPAVLERQEQESAKLAARLAEREPPIIWGGRPLTDLEADDIALQLPSEPVARAGETFDLPITVRNRGDRDAMRLYGLVAADDASPFWESEIIFGTVPAGQERQGMLRLRMPPRIGSGMEHFDLQLFQQGRNRMLLSEPVHLRVEGDARPHLGYRWRLEDADGNGAIDLDEAVTLSFEVHNSGDAATAPLVVFLRKEDNPYVQLEAGRWKLDPIPAGGKATVAVPLTVRGSLTVGSVTKANDRDRLELAFSVEERFEEEDVSHYMTESLYHELDLPLGEGLTGAHVRQPRIVVERRTVDGSGSLDLAYRIEDDNPRYVALFLDQDKVSVEAVEDEERQFEYRLQLDPGVNQVRIVVHDDDGISRVELLRLWGPREAVPVDETGSLVEMP